MSCCRAITLLERGVSKSSFVPLSIRGVGRTAAVAQPGWDSVPNCQAMVLRDVAYPVYRLSESDEAQVKNVAAVLGRGYVLDRVAVLAIVAAQQAITESGWISSADLSTDIPLGICLGSSRGATESLETAITRFDDGETLTPLVSPTTTAGGIASEVARWLAKDFSCDFSLAVSLSATCTSSALAIVTAWGWLQGGLVNRVLAGGAEAPLTPFTLAMMGAMRIYGAAPRDLPEQNLPCTPLHSDGKNSFVLGEGSAVFALERYDASSVGASRTPAVLGVGVGFEVAQTRTGVTPAGDNFFTAMVRAHKTSGFPDLIIMHAPGTAKGDVAEFNAIKRFVSEYGADKPVPWLCTLKFMTGHTFGAAAGLGINYALHLLGGNSIIAAPYPDLLHEWNQQRDPTRPLKRIFVNSGGFGGVAATVVIGWVQDSQ